MAVKCPHCRNQVADDPASSGQPVICPHCRGAFKMPGMIVTPANLPALPPFPQPQPEQPQFTIRIASDPKTRVRASGWFSRSLAGAAGVFVALFLFLATCGGVLYGGFLYFTAPIRETIREHTDARTEAVVAARKVLASYRITEISKDAAVSPLTLDARATHLVVGKCKHDGQTKPFALWLDRSEFEKATEWKVIKLEVGGAVLDETK